MGEEIKSEVVCKVSSPFSSISHKKYEDRVQAGTRKSLTRPCRNGFENGFLDHFSSRRLDGEKKGAIQRIPERDVLLKSPVTLGDEGTQWS